MSKNFKSQKAMCLLKLTSNSSLPLGVISFLNYLTFDTLSLDQNVTTSLAERSRLGIGPVTTALPTEDEGSRPEVTSLSDREEKLPNADLPNAEVPRVEGPNAELPNT